MTNKLIKPITNLLKFFGSSILLNIFWYSLGGIVGLLALLSVFLRGFYKILISPMPLWATTALVLTTMVYVHIKVLNLQSKEKILKKLYDASNSIQSPRFVIKYGIFLDENKNALCPVDKTPMQSRIWNKDILKFTCPKCNKQYEVPHTYKE
jgi:hypothetical protein